MVMVYRLKYLLQCQSGRGVDTMSHVYARVLCARSGNDPSSSLSETFSMQIMVLQLPGQQ